MRIMLILAFVLALCWRKLNPCCPFCESENIRRTELVGEYICGDCEGIF